MMSGTYELKLAAILILLFASVLTPANASLSLQQQCSYYFGKLHGSEFLYMPYVIDMGLSSIHSIDYDHSIKKLSERAHHLTAFHEEILSNNQVSIKFQEQVIPSKNPIRAIRMMNGELVVFDGNGRLESLRMAFSNNPNLKVEVDIFTNSSPTIDEFIHRIRLRNGLEVPTVTPPPEFPKEAKHFFALLQQSQKKHNPHLDHQLFAHANELRLLLYDEAKWYELLNDLLKKPGNELEIANSYRLAALLHMPDDLRFKVLRKISSEYSQLSKSRSRIGIKLPVFLTRNLFAPKRFADFILRNLIRADLIIDQAIKEEGHSTLEGLQKSKRIKEMGSDAS